MFKKQPKSELPPEIYLSVVDSLYGDARTLFVGSVAISLAIFLTAWMSASWAILACGVTTVAVAALRSADVQAYLRRRPNLGGVEEARQWEWRYTLGAAVYISLLGAWCLTAALDANVAAVNLISITSVIAYMIGISGRNFGSSRLVTTQILCAGIPVVSSLLMMGSIYYKIFALLIIAFFLSNKFISDRLRKTLWDAAIAARNEARLARRFDTALNNMPHGLCMFDAERRLMVSNGQAARLLGFSAEGEHKGRHAQELLAEGVRTGVLDEAERDRLVGRVNARLGEVRPGTLLAATRQDRTLEFTFQPMERGGSVVLVEDVTERLQAEARIAHLARYDELTGLPNRTHFREQIDRALMLSRRDGTSCAVMFIDLDQFKQVNDTLGHPCGDQLLCMVAARLRQITRDSDIIARFGGDEFVLLQTNVEPSDVASLADRVVERLSQPYDVEGHDVVIGASIGITVAPRDGTDTDHLLKNADMALYQAKSGGRGIWCFFENEMDVQARARRDLERDLRAALANDGFDIYYQPLINLKTKRVGTCEALLRWPHPERGMISPAEFIPVAEEMGLIVDIGAWVLRRACAECTRWPDDVRVAVNLSSIQFRRGNVVEMVRDALRRSGLPANRLEVEITESVLLQDTQHTRNALQQLRELGVRTSLDDFGTGYSSLSYLHSFPFDKVKIDRSFLQGIVDSDRALILLRGMSRLSASLGMSVAIEGVETKDQFSVIVGEPSIDEMQGFLFSRPIPAESIRNFLGTRAFPRVA
jgi:diguanylate cyclase (GGDEF)-like protein/PAS domain S-box-containing protein